MGCWGLEVGDGVAISVAVGAIVLIGVTGSGWDAGVIAVVAVATRVLVIVMVGAVMLAGVTVVVAVGVVVVVGCGEIIVA